MQMTRKAPTVCSAATVEADNSVKNMILRAVGLSPIERAWVSSKKVTIRSFHLTMRTANETKPMMASCRVSSGVIARMLPSTMVWMFTEVGESDTMKSPRPKKEEKISPMMASSFSLVRWLRKSMAAAARPPEKKAPMENGRPSM